MPSLMFRRSSRVARAGGRFLQSCRDLCGTVRTRRPAPLLLELTRLPAQLFLFLGLAVVWLGHEVSSAALYCESGCLGALSQGHEPRAGRSPARTLIIDSSGAMRHPVRESSESPLLRQRLRSRMKPPTRGA